MKQINGMPINEAYRFYPDLVDSQDIQDSLDRLNDIETVLINNTSLWSDMTAESLEDELTRLNSWQDEFPGYTPEELREEIDKQGRFIEDLKEKIESEFGKIYTSDPDTVLECFFEIIDEHSYLKRQISELSEKFCK